MASMKAKYSMMTDIDDILCVCEEKMTINMTMTMIVAIMPDVENNYLEEACRILKV